MANRRVLVKRRKAARNIRKITRTMQLISTARFQAAYKRATASKPYAEKLGELAANLARAAGGAEHPLARAREGATGAALLVLTSNRGLCGGYNANVLRAAVERVDAAGAGLAVHMVGKKGASYFRFTGRPLAERLAEIGETPRFETVEPLASRFIDAFLAGEIASLDVAYMKFLSAGKQAPVVERILPLAAAPAAGEEDRETLYEFTPSARQILDEVLPATVRLRIFQCFTDAMVSEQVARMVAMKAATDAAGDMIKRLTRKYNRARQTQITMELLDIVGGANALA
jgi:F-type H+-transporting ATPase subunit gamma